MYKPVATTMFSSVAAATRAMRGMYRPSPITVRSTMVSTPRALSSPSRAMAPATRLSSSPQASG
ncbi:Uncharacterised protein [Mycobacterium tuberculosis]|uniref:Uncharacterized protein n=2 Tax=Mycobacterium tuberculosis TaxID=1773 RepID=A0A654TXC7_MYCTX|nr:Uncharacterised protein [Mycobacterium tuberculosis]COX69241.1 Uncharacterised protein [Mycobacterium tuberculosis]